MMFVLYKHLSAPGCCHVIRVLVSYLVTAIFLHTRLTTYYDNRITGEKMIHITDMLNVSLFLDILTQTAIIDNKVKKCLFDLQ